MSNPQSSPFPPLTGYQNSISISVIANPFTLLGFNKLHSFLKKIGLTSAKSNQSSFSTDKKEKEQKTHLD